MTIITSIILNQSLLENNIIEGDNPVDENLMDLDGIKSIVHWILSKNLGISISNFKYSLSPIAKEYREGKLKRTRERVLKELET